MPAVKWGTKSGLDMVLSARCSVLGTRCSVLGTRYSVLGTLLSTEHQALISGARSPSQCCTHRRGEVRSGPLSADVARPMLGTGVQNLDDGVLDALGG